MSTHDVLEIGEGLHYARCCCGATASVVSADAGRIWHALHKLWPDEEAAQLANRMRAALEPPRPKALGYMTPASDTEPRP